MGHGMSGWVDPCGVGSAHDGSRQLWVGGSLAGGLSKKLVMAHLGWWITRGWSQKMIGHGTSGGWDPWEVASAKHGSWHLGGGSLGHVPTQDSRNDMEQTGINLRGRCIPRRRSHFWALEDRGQHGLSQDDPDVADFWKKYGLQISQGSFGQNGQIRPLFGPS